MFEALETIDWSAMNHAYGPAGDVPGMLRGLADADPATREEALDGIYGAVHHQGDVYECTVAAIPFLFEIVKDTAIDGRGDVLGLLSSIGGVDGDDLSGHPLPLARDPLYARARRIVADARPLYFDLLTDEDPGVRRAAVLILLTADSHVEQVTEALRGRFDVEADPDVRAAMIETLGRLGGFGQTDWLMEQARRPAGPVLRLTALTAVARTAPEQSSSDVVETALATFREIYARDAPPAAPAGYSTDTLIGVLREQAETEAAWRRNQEASGLLHDFSEALGERVAERTRLLIELLRSPDLETRYDASLRSWRLLQRWRGDYDELVGLIGEQLLDERPRLRERAAETLKDLGDLAAPAADALAAQLENAPREAPSGPELPWLVLWEREPRVGPTLHALTRLRDPRALPALRCLLERPEPVRYIGHLVSRFGPGAAELVPIIRERLRELTAMDGDRWQTGGLVYALVGIGEAAADAVDELLALPADNWPVLTALGDFGHLAGDAVIPVVRRALAAGDCSTQLTAARTLWKLTRGPEPVLPVLMRHLSEEDCGGGSPAAAIALLGPAAVDAAGPLRRLLNSERDGGHWTRLGAAETLWKVTGDADAVLPVLTELWPAHPRMRQGIAECFADMGTQAATAVPLLRDEIARKRRHNSSDSGWSSEQVTEDLTLLRACREALTSCGETTVA